jgi:hypothetical protein
VPINLEYLKSKGYKFNITTHGYSVEYQGDVVAWDRPLFRKRYGSRIDLANNLDKAFKEAEKYFWRKYKEEYENNLKNKGMIPTYEKHYETMKHINRGLLPKGGRQSAIDHIAEHGNLVLWGNNLCVIMDMYEDLKANNLIVDAGKHWKVVENYKERMKDLVGQ